ncbi:hypothetical protein [Streptosporangium roseum]|uniref:hypothetical protein n=1 Tax=Streptosporangium roseum TaxID=2001 RepID=UPI0033194E2C
MIASMPAPQPKQVEALIVYGETCSMESDESPQRVWPNVNSDLFREVAHQTATTAFPLYRRSTTDPWFGHVEGFRLAASAILKEVETGNPNQDSMVLPFLVCWRHYVELHLKSLINQVQFELGLPVEVPKTHRLDRLWREAAALIDQSEAFDDDETQGHVGRLILQLHEMDPTGQEARYPINTKGSFTLEGLWSLDMRAFHNEMEGIAGYLKGSEIGIDEHFHFLREVAEEW